MKYFATVLFFCVLTTVSSAQITFSADEFFAGYNQATSGGTSFTSTDLTGLDALIAKSGSGQSWDLGNRTFTQDAPATGTSTILPYPGGLQWQMTPIS